MEKHKKKYLKDYKEPSYTIEKIDLKFDIYDDFTKVTSNLTVFKKQIMYITLSIVGYVCACWIPDSRFQIPPSPQILHESTKLGCQ